MRRLIAIVLALALAGCAQRGQSVLEGGSVPLLPVVPGVAAPTVSALPVGIAELDQVELIYAAVQRVALEYVRLRQCRASEVASITNLCARRAVKVMIGNADRQISNRNETGVLDVYRAAVRAAPNVSHAADAVVVRQAIEALRSVLVQNGVN